MNILQTCSCVLLAICLVNCKQPEGARRPISSASGTFMKKSADRNKLLVASEEDIIKKIIKSNPKITYFTSKKGYWYTYDERNTNDTLRPRKGDIAYYNMEVRTIKGDLIYSESDLGPQTYYVDKQEIIIGLRDGIKLMRKNETVDFLFPSHMAYGYHGDNKKIGINQSIICKVTLKNFVPENPVKITAEPTTNLPIQDTIQP